MTDPVFDYSGSTFDTRPYIDALNQQIRQYCLSHPLTSEDRREVLIALLLRYAVRAACHSVHNREGGPFGALLVDFETADDVPLVVGFGTNHVVTMNDPSAHAEICAIRSAAQQLGRSDLSDLTLITSCECCPMCLAAAVGCKISRVYFAATRSDAARAGFSDENQYGLMARGGIEQHARKAPDIAAAEHLLSGHDAMVQISDGEERLAYFGDYATANPDDPTDLPVIQAIKRACRGLALRRSKASGKDMQIFHLPDDALLISRDTPHPLSLVMADWARIGRIRGSDAHNPADDAPAKDNSRILYLRGQFEAMLIRDKQGQEKSIPAQRVWEEIRHPSAIRITGGISDCSAFDAWNLLVCNNAMPRY